MTSSNAFIFKAKNIFWNLFYIFEMYIKFWAFWKKRSLSCLQHFRSYWFLKKWMPESSCFRTPFGSYRVKGSQTLLKYARQHFHAHFPLISNKLTCVSCLLVASKKLRPAFSTLTPNHTCILVIIERNSRNKFQISSKPKTFSQNYLDFWNLQRILSILKK